MPGEHATATGLVSPERGPAVLRSVDSGRSVGPDVSNVTIVLIQYYSLPLKRWTEAGSSVQWLTAAVRFQPPCDKE